MDKYILTKIQRPENSKLTSDHQQSTKPTLLIMYEERGPVGTEHFISQTPLVDLPALPICN